MIADIEDLVARGDFLVAYDVISGLDLDALSQRDRTRLQYLRILCLARSGATDRAEGELAAVAASDAALPPDVAEDIAALRGRLAKDRALALVGEARRDAASTAAGYYQDVYEQFGRPYACINAATLWLLAGDTARAKALATRAVKLVRRSAIAASRDYWALATEAEAALIYGDATGARHHLESAREASAGGLAARASTRRQLSVICEHQGIDPGPLLEPIANPVVLHYTGHTAGSRGSSGDLAPEALETARHAVTAWLDGRNVGFAHGSLASGADILIAEAVLATGAELHVVLPFDEAEFVAVSVRPAGGDWEARYTRCLASAASVTVSCDSAYLGHDELFTFASRVAMGRAMIRARALASDAVQLAIWDGRFAGPAGTSQDVAVWRAAGGSTHVIEVARTEAPSAAVDDGPPADPRPVRALLFGDVVGFSKLRDEDIVNFVEQVLPSLAATLERFDDSITDRNTWGDAIFVAMDSVTAAAQCALALQRDLASHYRFPMRMSVHVGPVLSLPDAVRRIRGTFGRELTRAARIEPRTPPGEVYTTAAFASLLALEPAGQVHPEYVGSITTAKDFETIPMYVLKDSSPQHSGC